MVLKSGTKQIARVLGCYDRPSGPHGQDNMSTGGGGMKFNVSDMVDKSIGRLDSSKVTPPVNPSRMKPDGSINGA
jgi:hypothetical protein